MSFSHPNTPGRDESIQDNAPFVQEDWRLLPVIPPPRQVGISPCPPKVTGSNMYIGVLEKSKEAYLCASLLLWSSPGFRMKNAILALLSDKS